MALANPRTVAIFGGGITGLSSAYYLKKKFGPSINPVILEKSGRCGGWIKSIVRSKADDSDSYFFETGPRSVRPDGMQGKNTLDLVEEIGLHKDVLYVTNKEPVSKNRYIYVNGELNKLPNSFASVFRTIKPFSKPLIFTLFQDLLQRKETMSDDSIYNFVNRRFGDEVANFLIDPLIRGVCAGESRNVSVKFLMKQLFEWEQEHGSVVKGFLKSRWNDYKNPKTAEDLGHDKGVGFSGIALTSLGEAWSVWTIEGGLQNLPHRLEEVLVKDEVEIVKNATVKSIKFKEQDGLSVVNYTVDSNGSTSDRVLRCDHIISAMPAFKLGDVIKNSTPGQNNLWAELVNFTAVDVQVTNVMYDRNVLDQEAFGFLVPSVEKSVPGLLGVVFDTCSFTQGKKTVLTLMANGYSPLNDLKVKKYLERTLNIFIDPDDYYSEILKQCIPQYAIGHYEKVTKIKDYIKKLELPLTLVGASYDGVSVNDCIYSSKQAVDNFV